MVNSLPTQPLDGPKTAPLLLDSQPCSLDPLLLKYHPANKSTNQPAASISQSYLNQILSLLLVPCLPTDKQNADKIHVHHEQITNSRTYKVFHLIYQLDTALKPVHLSFEDQLVFSLPMANICVQPNIDYSPQTAHRRHHPKEKPSHVVALI